MEHALSVDLEEYFHVSNFENVIGPGRWDALPSRVEASTRCLLDSFDDHASRATFFVLGWVAERHAGLLREIASRGHEIACHGLAHELVTELGPGRFRANLRRAREIIEDASGVRVRGYRAPSFSITRDSLWALDILADEGFDYDSSIFPTRHPRYGIPDFARKPLRLRLPSGRSILEFPLTTLRVGNLNLPIAGGAYLRFLPAALFRWAFERAARPGQPNVLYLHPWEIDPGQPRQPVGPRIRLNHYYNLRRTEGRLRRLLARHAFVPLGQLLDALEAAGPLPVRALADGAGRGRPRAEGAIAPGPLGERR